jgi:hypothetical protein
MRTRMSTVMPTMGLLIPFLLSVSSQDSSPPKPYDLDEAYQIYSLLIPNEEAYQFGKATAIIQEDTVSHPLDAGCFEAKAAVRFNEAFADYSEAQRRTWLLQRRFQIERPYELVRSDTIRQFFNEHGPEGWKDFNQRYPGSGGFIIVSPVGFNKSNTLAVVYTGSSCGGLCGRWIFHLLEKDKGKWKAVPGVTCATVS